MLDVEGEKQNASLKQSEPNFLAVSEIFHDIIFPESLVETKRKQEEP